MKRSSFLSNSGIRFKDLTRAAVIHRVVKSVLSQKFSQAEVKSKFVSPFKNTTHGRWHDEAWMNSAFDSGGVEFRHLLFDPAAISKSPRASSLVAYEAFEKSLILAREAVFKCFSSSSSYSSPSFEGDAILQPHDVDMVIGGSEIAYGLPHDLFIHTREPFRSNIIRAGFTRGFGCVGSAISFSNAHRHLIAHPEHTVQILHVDAFSSQFEYGYHRLLDHGEDELLKNRNMVRSLLVPAILLGDAAAAATVVGSKHPLFNSLVYNQGMPAIVDSETYTLNGSKSGNDVMGYHTREWGSMAFLTEDIPVAGSTAIQIALDVLLKRHHLSASDIAHWIVHPGGSPVLRLLQTPPHERKKHSHMAPLEGTFREVSLTRQQLASSWHVLQNFGNCVGPTLLLVLEHALANMPPAVEPELIILAGVGPSITSCVLLLQRLPQGSHEEAGEHLEHLL